MADLVVGFARYVVGVRALGVWAPWALAALLAAAAPGVAGAQEAPHSGTRVSLSADRNTLTVGDIVTLTLDVTHPADHVVIIPRLIPEWGSFEVVSQTLAQTKSNADGTETTSQQMEVTLFAPGTFETPGLSISVRAPDGSVEHVSPLPVRLTVDSVLSGPDETLKDLRPYANLSPPWWRQPAALAGAALAILAVLITGSYLARHRILGRGDEAVSAEDTRTPWEAAVQEINRIDRLDLPGDGRFKEHYTLIAGITRAYARAMFLGNAGRTDATEMTTEQLTDQIWASSLDRKFARLVVDLLLEADLVRFSNYSPPASQAYEALGRTRDIVEGTQPVEEDVEQKEDALARPEVTA